LIAGETGVAHSTVHAILKRNGCSRAPRQPREAFKRYEWPCPGDLLHMDVKRYPRFARPGHAVTGDRTKTGAEKRAALGHDYFHAIVDDHSRLAYGELLGDERAQSTTAFLARALAWFDTHGISCRRVMTDGAWNSTHNNTLRALLSERGICHIVTPPYTPRWNGKVERFHQTTEPDGPKACATATATRATPPCHTGCATTTSAGPTAHSAADHRSTALTTSPGTTTSRGGYVLTGGQGQTLTMLGCPVTFVKPSPRPPSRAGPYPRLPCPGAPRSACTRCW
jgi:transposase InsO family protein